MGVTYKLKKEVVDYILLQKRTSPSLSCRKISDLASQFFQKKISKSSVNTILKTFLLSSPIGRRSREDKKQEKFKIPEYRKKELFVNVPRELLGEEPAAVVVQEKKEYPLKKLGSFILKAAELQIAKEGFVSFLTDSAAQSGLAGSFLYAPLFGISDQSVLAEEIGWQKINGINASPPTQEIHQATAMLKDLENKKQEISLKSSEIFTEVKCFKFILKNGNIFCIDAQFNSVWTKDNVHSSFSLPLEKSLDFLSKKIATNIRPIVLRCAPGIESFPSYFYTMLACFEGFPSYGVAQVDLISKQDEILSSFDTVLHKRRHFITFLPNSHMIFAQALEKKGVTQEKAFNFINQNVLYSESDLIIENPLLDKEINLRAFILKIEGQEPFVLISNIPKPIQIAEQIINQYFAQWPHPGTGHQDFMMTKEEPTTKDCSNMFSTDEKSGEDGESMFLGERNTLAHNFLMNMHRYCREHFFPSSCKQFSFKDAQNVFYRLSGFAEEQDGIVKVSLILPQEYTYIKELKYILRRVNESNACLNQKIRIFFANA
ncbi:MAG: hypothetical protein PHY73_00585 [Candidatus Omnitrophica bacterium]|nr:hypothetical protein [Candidatus Omnitrophota bacterium]